jgi:phytanoyl-CoA hydroxylase
LLTQTADEFMLNSFRDNGFIVLEGFASDGECVQLRARAAEMVQEFDPTDIVAIFSTNVRNKLS